jgi:hypothetical protein
MHHPYDLDQAGIESPHLPDLPGYALIPAAAPASDTHSQNESINRCAWSGLPST